PSMQQAAFDDLGLDAAYEAMRVTSAALPATFAELRRTHVGMNVTAPLKDAVIRVLDDVDPLAAAVRSVNTVLFAGGRAHGTSTDGAGFLAALAEAGLEQVGSAVILGAGGAARAVGAALAGSGAAVAIVSRSPERARAVADVIRV